MADITFGPFTIDLAASRLLRGGTELRMRPQAFYVLRTLAAHGGRVIDCDQLIREAWDGTVVSRHTVHVTIAEVRRILTDCGSWIVHQPKGGYCLRIPKSDTLIRHGYHFLSLRSREGFERALECFQEAAAEAAGFDSVWAGEHLVVPDPQVPPSPMAPQDPVLDSLLALTWAAAHTATIRLATGIVILPQRNPVLLAKQVATLDVLSGGRVMLGVGAGYLEPEFRAVGANFAERGAVTDEYLDAMRALWYDEHPEFRGRFASFGGVDAHPRPVQRPAHSRRPSRSPHWRCWARSRASAAMKPRSGSGAAG